MKKLQAIEIDGEMIYLETQDDVEAPDMVEDTGERGRTGQKGIGAAETQMAQSFKLVETTIKTYTKHTLNAFKDAALADVEKVTLEFGLNVSGNGGIPYVAAGTVGCNIKVTVECAFPKRQTAVTTQVAAQSAGRSHQAGGMPLPPPRTPLPQ